MCVPVYNAEDFLPETLDSILSQDFTDFRLLLSVAASDDSSLAICRSYTDDPRVSVFEQKQRLGLHWGVANSGRIWPWSRHALTRRILQSLHGRSAQFAAGRSFSGMTRQIRLDDGVVGASKLARQVEREARRGRTTAARKLFRQALARDPHAGWAGPFLNEFPGLAETGGAGHQRP